MDLLWDLLFVLAVPLAICLVPGAAAGAAVGWRRNRLMAGLCCGSISGMIGGCIGAWLYGIYLSTLPFVVRSAEMGPYRHITNPPPEYMVWLAIIGGSLIFAIVSSVALVRRFPVHARNWCFTAAGLSLAMTIVGYFIVFFYGAIKQPVPEIDFILFDINIITSTCIFAAAYFFFAAIGVRNYPAFLTKADWMDSSINFTPFYSVAVKACLVYFVTSAATMTYGLVGTVLASTVMGIIAALVKPPDRS